MSGIISGIAGSILGIGSGIFLLRNHNNSIKENFYSGYRLGCNDQEKYIKDKEWAHKYTAEINDPTEIEQFYKNETGFSYNDFYGWDYNEIAEAKYYESLLQESYIERCKKENPNNPEKYNMADIFKNHLEPAPYNLYIKNHNLRLSY